MYKRLHEIKARAEVINNALRELMLQIAAGRRKAFADGATCSDKEALMLLEERGIDFQDELAMLAKEMQHILRIPDGVVDAIEREEINAGTSDTISRKSIAHEQIKSTNKIEDELPKSLEEFRRLIDLSWLNNERSKKHRLDSSFLTAPLSIVRNIRIESEKLSVHRFAQIILTAEDFINNDEGYDFIAGALLIPQLTALGSRIDDLKAVSGPVNERLTSLWKSGSSLVESSIYELLIAASCARKGRQIEFLKPTSTKSPDMRVHDYYFPLVIECKRQKIITEYEIKEEIKMRDLFDSLYNEAMKIGLRGSFKLALNIEADQMPTSDIVAAALRQRFTPEPWKELSYEWGSIAFAELPSRIEGNLTKLYSPTLLQHVFGWDFDMPEYDGIICKVDSPDSIYVDYIKNPVGLLWTNNSINAIRKRARSSISLYADATKQIPPGEAGLIYICYQEGAREIIADERTAYFAEEVRKWGHEPSIRLPAFFLTRLVPRPLNVGMPDLIETGFRFLSELYGDQIYFKDFPSTVFTKN